MTEATIFMRSCNGARRLSYVVTDETINSCLALSSTKVSYSGMGNHEFLKAESSQHKIGIIKLIIIWSVENKFRCFICGESERIQNTLLGG